MENGLMVISQKEYERDKLLRAVQEKRISQKEAAEQLQITTRHFRRLQKLHRKEGIKGIISQKRGKVNNRKWPQEKLDRILHLLTDKYKDCGPTFACEKINEIEKIKCSKEKIREIMIQKGLWKPKKKKEKKIYHRRAPRERKGELIQVDGSYHKWFEERGSSCCLLVAIDDATSELMHCKFVQSESEESYQWFMKEYIEKHGKPVTIYTDKHSVFRVTRKELISGSGKTKFHQALKKLNIELICAHSPQAKGRVERANETLQDRLIKEMRLRGIDTVEEGNRYLVKEFIPDFNQRFGKKAQIEENAHRAIDKLLDFNKIFSITETRKISKNLTIQFENIEYQLVGVKEVRRMIGKTVEVTKKWDKGIEIHYQGKALKYKLYTERPKAVEISDARAIAWINQEIR